MCVQASVHKSQKADTGFTLSTPPPSSVTQVSITTGARQLIIYREKHRYTTHIGAAARRERVSHSRNTANFHLLSKRVYTKKGRKREREGRNEKESPVFCSRSRVWKIIYIIITCSRRWSHCVPSPVLFYIYHSLPRRQQPSSNLSTPFSPCFFRQPKNWSQNKFRRRHWTAAFFFNHGDILQIAYNISHSLCNQATQTAGSDNGARQPR